MKYALALTAFSLLLAGCSTAPKPTAETGPGTYRVNFETSRGAFVVEVNRGDAPLGADRFYTLVKGNFYDGARFFRVVPGFIVQFGIAGDPKVHKSRDIRFQDDPVKATNARGTLSFATAGPNTRTTQMFINLADNPRLDGMGFSAFGKVVTGMDVVDRIYSGDGEGPEQPRIEAEGNAYLEKAFPKLDFIKSAKIAN